MTVENVLQPTKLLLFVHDKLGYAECLLLTRPFAMAITLRHHRKIPFYELPIQLIANTTLAYAILRDSCSKCSQLVNHRCDSAQAWRFDR